MLVGRTQELAGIQADLRAALESDGRLLVVAGEPGIGKTRLAEEAQRLASRLGMATAWGRATDEPSACRLQVEDEEAPAGEEPVALVRRAMEARLPPRRTVQFAQPLAESGRKQSTIGARERVLDRRALGE